MTAKQLSILEYAYQALLINHLKAMILKNIKSKNPAPDLIPFSDPGAMQHFFDALKQQYKDGFYVNASKERKSLKPTMGYIGRYARRSPMSELRIKDYDGEWITFDFKDYDNNGSKGTYTLKTV